MYKNKEHIKKVSDFVKNTVEDLLKKINVDFDIEIIHDKDINAMRFLIKTNEPNLLIGNKGVNLSALSHVVKRIVDKKFDRDKEERVYFIVDVNNYRGDKIEEIKTNAHMLAQRAMYFKNDVRMNPLSSHDRLVVHSLFAGSKDFKTISEGEGDERRIVIQYVGK